MWKAIINFLHAAVVMVTGFQRSAEVRKQRYEDKRPLLQQRLRKRTIRQTWKAVKRLNRIKKRAKRKGLEDELNERP